MSLAAALVNREIKKIQGDCEFLFTQGIGRRRGRIHVLWLFSKSPQPVIWLSGSVYHILDAKLMVHLDSI